MRKDVAAFAKYTRFGVMPYCITNFTTSKSVLFFLASEVIGISEVFGLGIFLSGDIFQLKPFQCVAIESPWVMPSDD